MTYQSYSEALHALHSSSPAIPVADLIRSVAPHITKEEIDTMLAFVDRGYRMEFAAPPLHIKDAFHMISVTPSTTGTPSIRSDNAGRLRKFTLESIRGLYLFPGDSFPFGRQAVEYANSHWPEQLVEDRSRSFVTINIADLTNLRRDSSSRLCPSLKVQLHFTTSDPWLNMRNKGEAPESEIIDEVILKITHSALIASELRAGRGGYVQHNCASCGGGLVLSGCSGCKRSFDDDGARGGWTTPLPRRLVDYMVDSIGHQFEIDPEIARAAEREEWDKERRRRFARL